MNNNIINNPTSWSLFSDGKKQWKNYGYRQSGQIIRHGDPNIEEHYTSDYDTRTDLSDVDYIKSKKHILFFGDSFTYGHGLSSEHSITKVMQHKINDDYILINLGKPGAGSDKVVEILCQWMNCEYASNAHTVVVNFPDLSRATETRTENFKDWGDKKSQLYNEMANASTDIFLMPKFYTPGWAGVVTEKDSEKIHAAYYKYFCTPVTDLKRLEKNLLLITSLCKLNNINLISWHWSKYLNSFSEPWEEYVKSDDEIFGSIIQNLQKSFLEKGLIYETILDIREKVILGYDTQYGNEDTSRKQLRLADGHYSKIGNKILSDIIYDTLKGII
jgi:hypothetical protein